MTSKNYQSRAALTVAIIVAAFAPADNLNAADKQIAGQTPATTNVNVTNTPLAVTLPSAPLNVNVTNSPLAVTLPNTPAQPLPTKDQLNPASRPILSYHGSAPLATNDGAGSASYAPPAGQRAMIRNLSFSCQGASTMNMFIFILDAQSERIAWMPLQNKPYAGVAWATGSMIVDLMVDAGPGITIYFQRDVAGPVNCEVGILGYLVPMP
jgi:hypothetical protein